MPKQVQVKCRIFMNILWSCISSQTVSVLVGVIQAMPIRPHNIGPPFSMPFPGRDSGEPMLEGKTLLGSLLQGLIKNFPGANIDKAFTSRCCRVYIQEIYRDINGVDCFLECLGVFSWQMSSWGILKHLITSVIQLKTRQGFGLKSWNRLWLFELGTYGIDGDCCISVFSVESLEDPSSATKALTNRIPQLRYFSCGLEVFFFR